VIRKSLSDDIAAHALTLEIDLGHEIDFAFLRDPESRFAPGKLNLACACNDVDGCRKERTRQWAACDADARA
jgi:hypothetical protein